MSFSEDNLATIEDVAAQWAVRRADGLSAIARAEFEQWLATDPRHYAAFAEADLALGVLTPLHDATQRERLREELTAWEVRRSARRTWRHRIVLGGVGLAAAAVFVIAILPFATGGDPTRSDHATMTVRPHQQRLADGSIVELNSSAEIAVNFTEKVRAVRLLHGEAHFAVAEDKSRPFVVSIGRVKVRAVGTEFNIRYEESAVQVLVTEGTVAVVDDTTDARSAGNQNTQAPILPSAAPAVVAARLSAESSSELILRAGYRTVILLAPEISQKPMPAAVAEPEIRRALAWREMRFELSNATLDQAVALFNRKGQMQLAIEDDELRDRRISGIYWADNPTQFAELIESTLEIKAIRESSDRIVFRKQ